MSMLTGNCFTHITKTTRQTSIHPAGSPDDNSQLIEEPDDGSLSSPVLHQRQGERSPCRL
jgi:hypothetical protein